MNVFMMARILNYIVPFIRKPVVWLVIVILGLGIWAWCQSQKISSLQTVSLAQAQTIEQLNNQNAQLNNQLQAEQSAVAEQQKLTVELHKSAEAKRGKVRVIFKSEQCAGADLPDGVIEQLR